MNPTDTCTGCHHTRETHQETLMGTICYGRFWADERKAAPCKCTAFVEVAAKVIGAQA
jgi:hypothetical protein